MEMSKSKQKKKKEKSYHLKNKPVQDEEEPVAMCSNIENEIQEAIRDTNELKLLEDEKAKISEPEREDVVLVNAVTTEEVHQNDDKLSTSDITPTPASLNTDSYQDSLLLLKNEYENVTTNKPLQNAIPMIPVNWTEQVSASAPITDEEQNVISPEKIENTWKTMKPFTEQQLASLHNNQELNYATTVYVQNFISKELKTTDGKKHFLDELLANYLGSKQNLTRINLELINLKKESNELQNNLWDVSTRTIHGKGECHDNITVKAVEHLPWATFNDAKNKKLASCLATMKDLHQQYTLQSYSSQVFKLQIEHYILCIISSCQTSARLAPNEPVRLTKNAVNAELLQELHKCLSVLFSYQRRQINDKSFIHETREWIIKLGALLLRIASWEDHLFLLNHILRCPGGVANWAARLVQAPCPTTSASATPFSDEQINHIVTVMATILLPIEFRDEVLAELKISLRESRDAVSNNMWVLVDSDGEEDDDIGTSSPIRETDIVTLLNQVPMGDLFRNLLRVFKRDQQDVLDDTSVSELHVLRLLAWCSTWINLLRRGIQTYSTSRYNQLIKLLSRFVLHSVQYATDTLLIFRSKNERNCRDEAMLARLQVEYNMLIIRATHCVFLSETLGTWQFLAVMPFEAVSSDTLWVLYYMLHEGPQQIDLVFPEQAPKSELKRKLSEISLKQSFEENLKNLSDAEVYYLLQTFANMALARTMQDRDFIERVTYDLLLIGFFSSTRDTCSKPTRDLLSSLTVQYPELISNILLASQNYLSQMGQLSLYLFKELPLHMWVPTEADFELISENLLHSQISSHENNLARVVIAHLNWDFTEDGQMFLNSTIHLRIALLLVIATTKHYGEGLSKGSEQAMIWDNWSWKMALRLRLHILDQDSRIALTCLKEPSTVLNRIPEFENTESLVLGVKEKQSFANFISLLVTQLGHSVPFICSQGFNLLQCLVNSTRYNEVIVALHTIVPLFIECQESLFKCDKFKEVIISLFTADRGYIKMAKNLIISDGPGPVIEQFGKMIQSHMDNYSRYGLQDSSIFIGIWLQVITSVPDWYRDSYATYIIDIIMRTAFFSPISRNLATRIFLNLFQKQYGNSNQHSTSRISLFPWLSSSGPAPTLVTTAASNCAWFALVLLDIEHTELEIRTGLWRELLSQLANSTAKTNVDNSLKKAATLVKANSWGSANLIIYRIAQQALDTPLGHPILPLLWQKFFTLYLARVPATTGNADRGGVGKKFFDGVVNTGFLKKIKNRLNETLNDYMSKIPTNHSDLVKYHSSCATLFKTYLLWLEEDQLHEPFLFLPALPPQYDSQKLVHLFQNSQELWLDYVDEQQIQELKKENKKHWLLFCGRNRILRPTSPSKIPIAHGDSVTRLLHRLNSYDAPQTAPNLPSTSSMIPPIPPETITNTSQMINLLKPYLRVFREFSQSYIMRLSQNTALDCNLIELTPQLYSHKTYDIFKTVSCNISGQAAVHCAGPAVIKLKAAESIKDTNIDHQIQSNRAQYEEVCNVFLGGLPQKLCTTSIFITNIISVLESQYLYFKSMDDSDKCNKIQKVGVEMFYTIISATDENSKLYPPSNELFMRCSKKLGDTFLSGWDCETERLVMTTLKKQNLMNFMASLLKPPTAGQSFLQVYGILLKRINDTGVKAISLLLSKFEVDNWLIDRKPRLNERSQLIALQVGALISIGVNITANYENIHETIRRHLMMVFCHEWPEHYGEVLQAILQASSGSGDDHGSISVTVWKELLATLGFRTLRGQGITEEIRHYATTQNLLKHQELIDSAILLGDHFMNERLQYGLYGLYPKYRAYVNSLTTLLAMIGHALIVSTMQQYPGLLADKVCEIIWPALTKMFSPWLIPLWTQNLKNSPMWIQQLTDGRATILPWIQPDGTHAHQTIVAFVNTVRFVMDMLPACNSVLSFIWQFYAINYAHPAVKDYILVPIHSQFLTLPWERFWPSLHDVDLMLKIFDQYLPECHVLTGCVAMRVPWLHWLDVVEKDEVGGSIRAQKYLLPLFVKLAHEPAVRENRKQLQALLTQAFKFNWRNVDGETYDQLINWYVMSSDPKVILRADSQAVIDHLILDLLQASAEFIPSGIVSKLGPYALNKRPMFIRGYVRLLISATSKYKQLITTETARFRTSISQIIQDIEETLNKNSAIPSDSKLEGIALMKELLPIADDRCIGQLATGTIIQWLSNHAEQTVVLNCVLHLMGTVPQCPNATSAIFEAALTEYFNTSTETWTDVTAKLQDRQLCSSKKLPEIMAQNGDILATHATILLRFKINNITVNDLNDILEKIKPTKTNEAKIALIYGDVLHLCVPLVVKAIEENQEQTLTELSTSLQKFVSLLLAIADEKSGWGTSLLGAIGIRNKQDQITNRCRFLSRALALYIRAQLRDNSIIRCGGIFLEEENNSVSGLDTLRSNQSDIKTCADLVIKQIQDPKNSLHNVNTFLTITSQQLYNQSFLKNDK